MYNNFCIMPVPGAEFHVSAGRHNDCNFFILSHLFFLQDVDFRVCFTGCLSGGGKRNMSNGFLISSF